MIFSAGRGLDAVTQPSRAPHHIQLAETHGTAGTSVWVHCCIASGLEACRELLYSPVINPAEIAL